MANQRYDAFLAAARCGSFKGAAAELGYTQAGISYLVNALEQELGLTLFLREYGGVHLTTEGREVLGLVQAINADEHALATRVRELSHREGGLVRVGAFTSAAIEWFPQIAKAFLAQYPKIDLKLLCIDDEEELVEATWEGRADCAFSVAPERRSLDAVPLHTDPLLVVLPPDHPLAGADTFSTEALESEPYVQLQGNARPSEMEALFEANGVTPNVRFTVDSDYAVMSMVSAGLGFSVLPSLILARPLFPLAVLPPERPCAREIYLAVRSWDTASAATRAFAEVTERWVAERYGA
ncbi:LysR family transcriptional regulator [Adlercreutzia muris]|jgi:DNA-binding transcriptional LysR family regulator|uniref:LysR family transcriptional regulator n=1 Tax=Adlercreutzia muris TaxID=1796610 RepID=UPI0013655A96|nr:LysR family transcriptional regulator [Adlercreutzia muris]MCI8305298.1 LysR family transcriptional regulator [Enterorhabdus sp.]NCA32102.1 LysR family transcriptional regulator [Adlercreutzia muris]